LEEGRIKLGGRMESITSFASKYISENIKILQSLDADEIAPAVELVVQAGESGSRIYAIGNGGSASTASHFVNDMGKGASLGREKRFKVIPLTDNVEWMTALSNDLSYEDVYVEQLKNFAEKNDVLLAISGSGNSENVIRAVQYANETGCHTIGFTGFDGGKLKNLVDRCIVIDSDHMGRIEDMHVILQHIICYYFMDQEPSA
jgi:D-sedoheptulose 7-phosphate isomerase